MSTAAWTPPTRAEARLERRLLELPDQDAIGRELRRFERSRCGARARTRGHRPCRAKALENGRCVLHGGLSAGPTTLEGRLWALLNLRQYRHLRSEPPEVIIEALGHLLVRPHKTPSRKPPKAEPRERSPDLIQKVRLLAQLL